MFLAVTFKKVIDTPAQEAIAADNTVDPPIAAVAAVAEVSHQEVDQTYIEDSDTQVAENLALDRGIDYYKLKFNGVQLVATLHPVTLKTSARAAAPAREIAVIRADGADAGSAIVDA